MPTFVQIADGTKTVFNVSTSANAKTVRVNGVVVAPFSTTNGSVTLSIPPAVGAVVEVFYAPLKGADPTIAAGSAGYVPMAVENGYRPVITPVVQYFGAGADAVPFTLDPTARKVDVHLDQVLAATGNAQWPQNGTTVHTSF